MPDPKPAGPAPRRRGPTILLLMVLIVLVASLLTMLKHEADATAERRRAALEVEARLIEAAAQLPTIRKEQANREAAAKADSVRRFKQDVAEHQAMMTRFWDRLAEWALEADASEIPEIIREAERLRKQDATWFKGLRDLPRWNLGSLPDEYAEAAKNSFGRKLPDEYAEAAKNSFGRKR
jgi:hypothetical protein